MLYFVWFCIFLLVFANIKSIIRLKKSSSFLNKKHDLSTNVNKKIIVIIPAMNEVNNVDKSINYFKSLNDVCNVIYVTTSKEKSMATYKKLNNEIKTQRANNIKIINCPNTIGTMANQINYAIKKLKEDDIVAVYNIDSQPERKTFKYVLKNINDNVVLQQVSFFDDKSNGVLKSAENWQNRWSVVYEMGKYLNDSRIEFKYCIGHGLFVEKKIFDKIGYFSENEINEDNEFGYRLNINNISIKPIPFMEQADFAKNKKIYVKQQSTWVNGPLYALKYYRDNERTFKNFTLSILNFKAFISWCLFPWICYFCIIFSFIINIKLFILSLFLVAFYVTGINYVANRLLIKSGYIKNKYHINIISDLLFFAIHTFGSYITLYKLITGKNNIKNKYNTEK